MSNPLSTPAALMHCSVICCCLFAAPVWAQEINVSGAWVRGTVEGQKASGAFMELKSSENAVLLGASSPVAGVIELHEMTMDNGVMRMRALPRLELPAGKAVVFKPGSYHIMLLDLKHVLKKGEIVPLTLRVEGRDKQITKVEVTAEVRDLASMPGMSTMDGEHRHMH